jgi:hypothetical protein
MSRLNSFSSDLKHLIGRGGMKWGTYGKSQRNPLRWVMLSNMEDSHIRNILIDVREGKYNIPLRYIYHFQKELQLRIKEPQYSIVLPEDVDVAGDEIDDEDLDALFS